MSSTINYIELINRAWMMREQGLLSVRDHDLYNYLLNKSNVLKWQNPFKQSSEIICAILGINANTLMKRRKHLQEVGLIKFTEGVSRSCPAEYELCIPDSATRTKNKENARMFRKPSPDEIRNYCAGRYGEVDADKFFAYYEARNWHTGNQKIRSWKALVRLWHKNSDGRKNNIINHSMEHDTEYGQF